VGAKLLNYKLVISNYFQLLELLLKQQNTSYTYDIVYYCFVVLVTVHYRQNNETTVSKTEQNRLVVTVNCTKRTSVFFQYKQLLKCFVGHFSSVRPRYKPSETKQTLHWSRRWQYSIELHKQCLNKWIVVKHSNFFPRILQKLEYFQLVLAVALAVLLIDVLMSVLSVNP
jgi:hypothetical protein